MKKKAKKLAVLLIVICALAAQLITPASAAKLGSKVTVTVPTFDVTLNGHKVDNEYSQYPLLVYNDITYLPMTYHGARWMGLTTDWSAAKGLAISQHPGSLALIYNNYDTSAKNSAKYTAAVASFNIAVNGDKVDNSAQKYPLLIFRGVTYFPLTWAFCVNEFGWRYSFSAEKGLVINSQVASPVNSYNDGTNTWYVRDGILYSISGTQGWPKKVYELEWPTNYYTFTAGENGSIILKYQSSESATTSRRASVTINPDGTVTRN